MNELVPSLLEIAAAAGTAVMEVYRSGFEVREKPDSSPVTEADLVAHEIILRGLRLLHPRLPVLSEESAPPPFDQRRKWRRFWLVDPLDGTKEFVNRNSEFTVNIALIQDGRPQLGIVDAPALGQTFIGDVAAGQAERRVHGEWTPLNGRRMREKGPLTLVVSRSHANERLQRYLDDLADGFAQTQERSIGSSLKLCLLAAGEADLYPRLSPTSEWDIAAAEAVLCAAGGAVRQLNGQPLAYNKRDLLNPEFIAAADGVYPWMEKLPQPR